KTDGRKILPSNTQDILSEADDHQYCRKQSAPEPIPADHPLHPENRYPLRARFHPLHGHMILSQDPNNHVYRKSERLSRIRNFDDDFSKRNGIIQPFEGIIDIIQLKNPVDMRPDFMSCD